MTTIEPLPLGNDAEITARFERDVLPLHEALHRRALRLTRDAHEAEELLQDTLLQAFAGFRLFRDGSDAKAWAFRIMQNTWINRWRKQQRGVPQICAGSFTDDDLAQLPTESRAECWSAEDAALNMLPDNEIRSALMSLTEPFRLTIFYADVQGFSNKETAALMRTPVGTVMSRLHRGRRRLRLALAATAAERGYASSRARAGGRRELQAVAG